ncbi:MAG: hypothetical protein RO257_03150 [Candidatus Kapabacteria bacterium]|nr:hypothetical protein [Candidatus Kapabacteria bacterium]
MQTQSDINYEKVLNLAFNLPLREKKKLIDDLQKKMKLINDIKSEIKDGKGLISENLNESLDSSITNHKTKPIKRFSAIALETKYFKFDRESANER